MNDVTNIVKIGEWVVRQRIPNKDQSPKVMLLLHGWTGDENSMWIFTPRLPQEYLIISPRGMFRTPLGGYGWRNNSIKGWSSMSDFQPAIHALLGLVESLDLPENQVKRINVMGFSQGAALAYAFAHMRPERIDKLAGLSGFFPKPPQGTSFDGVLNEKKIFVAHGLRDDIVPVAKARQVVNSLKRSGAEVIYCEEDVGHKLSSGCFRGMDEYFSA
jgi:phospholipase/carboxylesterase